MANACWHTFDWQADFCGCNKQSSTNSASESSVQAAPLSPKAPPDYVVRGLGTPPPVPTEQVMSMLGQINDTLCSLCHAVEDLDNRLTSLETNVSERAAFRHQ